MVPCNNIRASHLFCIITSLYQSYGPTEPGGWLLSTVNILCRSFSVPYSRFLKRIDVSSKNKIRNIFSASYGAQNATHTHRLIHYDRLQMKQVTLFVSLVKVWDMWIYEVSSHSQHAECWWKWPRDFHKSKIFMAWWLGHFPNFGHFESDHHHELDLLICTTLAVMSWHKWWNSLHSCMLVI